MTARHAVYWVPAVDHPLWAAGTRWLADGPHRATARRYGFHATVKAPMRLNAPEAEFAAALAALARAHTAAPLPALAVGWLRGFLALLPVAPLPAAFDALATACVQDLDRFRVPFDAAERARRIAGLDDEQLRLFDRWGYPHLFHRWTFHLTLSDDLDEADDPALRDTLTADARAGFADALARPTGPGELAWCAEAGPGEPFVLRQRFPIGGGA